MNITEILFVAPQIEGLVSVIAWIVGICSSIAWGVILFTVFLKLITIPFDAISRIQMRKNSLIMEKMRPDLEKLQKQYANDKQLYNQKMMALYKKNGYSMFGACLPTIVTLVIFIVAISAFNGYSKYVNKKYFYDMSIAYNNAIYAGMEIDEEVVKYNEKDGKLVYDNYKIVNKELDAEGNFTSNGITYKVEKGSEGGNGNYYIINSSNGYVKYKQFYTVDGENYYSSGSGEYSLISGKIKELSVNQPEVKSLSEKNNFLKIEDKNYDEYTEGTEIDELMFLQNVGSVMAGKQYKVDNNSFLWVKNIWVADSPLAHPVESSWEKFKSVHEYKTKNGEVSNMNEDTYKLLIADLETQTTEANGYFILAIITAGISLLAQFVLSKSQKAAMELQTVDGQGAQTQKIMMWMMPILMAVFAFMYTAAFSIYMILSQVITIVFTLFINYIIDLRFKKKEGNKEPEKIRGRVYIPKEEPQPEKKSKKKKEEEKPDFINGGKKYLRGRKK